MRRLASTTTCLPSSDRQTICTLPSNSWSDWNSPAEKLVDAHPLFDHLKAVGEVVENFALRRQVGPLLAESPLDVSRGEHSVWLVQSHVRIRVDPHATNASPTVDQDDLLITRKVLARDEQCVESGQAGAHDANVTRFYQRRPLDWNWLQCGHRHLFRRSTPPYIAQQEFDYVAVLWRRVE